MAQRTLLALLPALFVLACAEGEPLADATPFDSTLTPKSASEAAPAEGPSDSTTPQGEEAAPIVVPPTTPETDARAPEPDATEDEPVDDLEPAPEPEPTDTPSATCFAPDRYSEACDSCLTHDEPCQDNGCFGGWSCDAEAGRCVESCDDAQGSGTDGGSCKRPDDWSEACDSCLTHDEPCQDNGCFGGWSCDEERGKCVESCG